MYSFDLKAATDRWPLGALGMLVDAMFDNTHASCIVCTLLGLNVFDIPFRLKNNGYQRLSFVTGQALGLHASWPLFALSHHVYVWQAAEQWDESLLIMQSSVMT